MTLDNVLARAIIMVSPLVALRVLGWLMQWLIRLPARATRCLWSVQLGAEGGAYRGRRVRMVRSHRSPWTRRVVRDVGLEA